MPSPRPLDHSAVGSTTAPLARTRAGHSAARTPAAILAALAIGIPVLSGCGDSTGVPMETVGVAGTAVWAESGAPITGAKVLLALVPATGDQTTLGTTETGPDGGYRLEAAVPEADCAGLADTGVSPTAEVRVAHPDYRADSRFVGCGENVIDFSLEAASVPVVVEGTVTSAYDGAPVVGAAMRMHEATAGVPPLLASSETDAEGRYRLEARVASPLCQDGTAPVAVVYASHPEYLDAPASPTSCGERTVDFSLEPDSLTLTVFGTVASADFGAPVPGVAMELLDLWEPAGVLANASTDADGRYHLEAAIPRPLCGTGEPAARVRAMHIEYRDTTVGVPGCGQRRADILMGQDDPVPPGYVATDDPTSCAGDGGTPHRASGDRELWTAEWGPHRVYDRVWIEDLTIGAGTVVCGGPDAVLGADTLAVQGTAAAPVLITSEDPAAPWSGLHVTRRGSLGYLTIRDAAGPGLIVGSYQVTITGTHLRIEDGDTTGLTTTIRDPAFALTWQVDGTRIVGNGAYPAEIPAQAMHDVVPDQEAADSLRGNAIDAVVLKDASYGGSLVFTPYIPWIACLSFFYSPTEIRLLAGATVSFCPNAEFPDGDNYRATLLAEGTAAAPVRILGGDFDVPEDVQLRYTELRDVTFDWQHGSPDTVGPAWTFDHVTAVGTRVRTATTGTRIADSRFDSSSVTLLGDSATVRRTALLHASGHGLAIAGEGTAVDTCRIAGSAGSGVLVADTAGSGITIHGCDLVDNAGPGVDNRSSFQVDATGNWWGSADGPTGPGGDGVAGDVVWEPFLTSAIPPW